MKLLTSRFVIPVSAPVIEDGAVLVEAGHIVRTGRAAELRADLPAGTVIEAVGDVALLPGFINPHTHLELTCYHGELPRAGLWEWFDHLLPKRVPVGAIERERAAVREGARLSLAAGVTLVGDISRTGITADAIADSPIRRVCFIELISGASQPPSTEVELQSITADAADRYRSDRTMIGVSPHAPYTVTPDDLRGSVSLARRRNWPLTMHLLETKEERDWLAGRPGYLADFLRDRGFVCAKHQPTSAAECLVDSGLLEAGPLLAHVNYLDERTLDALAASQASVVWCPRAHDYFGHSDHPWQTLLERGVNVCVGTDSLASNESLSILDELRFLAARYPDFPAATLLEMGTTRSARGLHLGSLAGKIAPGAWADFCAIPCDVKDARDVMDDIIRGGAVPQKTWIAAESVSTQVNL